MVKKTEVKEIPEDDEVIEESGKAEPKAKPTLNDMLKSQRNISKNIREAEKKK